MKEFSHASTSNKLEILLICKGKQQLVMHFAPATMIFCLIDLLLKPNTSLSVQLEHQTYQLLMIKDTIVEKLIAL